MITIQISSDPYKRMITYELVEDNQLIPINSSNSDIPEELKLLSVDYSSCFFPFKAYEIITAIWEAYRNPKEALTIRFKGTPEEYDEFEAVCKIVNGEIENENNKSAQNNNQNTTFPQIHWEKADLELANAQNILELVKKRSKSITREIDQNISDEENKVLIEEQRAKFDDVSKEDIPICVIGNYSAGKSTFINALIGFEVLPSGDKPMTAKIYEIHCSANSENAKVIFQIQGNEITIDFQRGKYSIVPNSFSNELYDEIHLCLESNVEKELSVRVQSLLLIINGKNIDSRIVLFVPFNSDSPLRSNDYKYVIFDTPGDNVVNHNRHIEVLQQALHGMSNGLMLYVTENKQMNTISNQALCEKVKSIQEIDTRFTMVIVNQADMADFSTYDKKEIIESPIPVELQPEGVYYVSSIMALGSKLNGNLSKQYYTVIFQAFKNLFTQKYDENTDEKTQDKILYLHNIAPKQIEDAEKKGAREFSELGESQLILANSGLWVIEQEIVRFAEQYAPYNKCFQSWQFLKKACAIAKEDYRKEIEDCDEERQEKQIEFECQTEELSKRIKEKNDLFVTAASNQYVREMESTRIAVVVPLSKDTLIELEAQFTKAQEEATGFYEQQKETEIAKDKVIKLVNLFDKNARSEFAANYRYWREKNDELDESRRNIDTYAADKLLQAVKDQFRIAISNAQNQLFNASKEYWTNQSVELRTELLDIVLGSSEISQQKRDELQGVLENFEIIAFTGEIEQIFTKEIFESHALQLGSIILYENHHLKKNKLADTFERELRSGANDIFRQMRISHEQEFYDWASRLNDEIENKLTDLNESLRKLRDRIAKKEKRIRLLQESQRRIDDDMFIIKNLMEWRPVATDFASE